MNAAPNPQPSTRPRKRRTRRVLGFVALGLVVLLGTAWFLRARLVERAVRTWARSQAGLDVRFEDLVVGGLSGISARRVSVRPLAVDQPLRALDVEDLEIDVDITGLWGEVELVRSVAAGRVDVDVDLTVPRAPRAPRGSEPFAWPSHLPSVEVASVGARVDMGSAVAELRGARVELSATPGAPRLAVDAQEFAWTSLDRRTAAPLRVAAHPGVVAARSDAASAPSLLFSATWGELATVSDAWITPGADGAFEAAARVDSGLGDAELEARSSAGNLRVSGTLRDFDLAGLIDTLGGDGSGFGGAWNARGAAVLPLDDLEQWTADAEIDARDPVILERRLDRATGRFLATADRFQVRDALLVAGANTAWVARLGVPRDADLGCEFLERAVIDLEADLGDVRPLLEGGWTLPDEVPEHRVRFRASLSDGWVAIERARAEVGANRVEMGTTRFPIQRGERLRVLEPSTEVELAVLAPDGAALANALLPQEFARELGFQGAISGSVHLGPDGDGVSARIVLNGREILARGVRVDDVAVRAQLSGHVLSVERLEIAAGAASVTAQGAIDLEARRFEAFEIAGDVPDVRALGAALSLEDRLPVGRARFRAQLDGPFRTPEGAIDVSAYDILVGETEISYARLRVRAEGGLFLVDEIRLEMPQAGVFRLAGEVRSQEDGSWRADVRQLDVTALEGSATLSRPARVTYSGDTLYVEGLDLAGGSGALRVEGSFAPDGVCADVIVESAWVGRVLRAFGLDIPASLRLDGRATVATSSIGPDVDGTIEADLILALDDLGDLRLPEGFRAHGSGTVHAVLSGPWSAPVGTLNVAARNASLFDSAGDVRLAGTELSLRARVGPTMQIEALVLELPREGRVEASGEVGMALDLARLRRGDFVALVDVPLDLRVGLSAPDLTPLASAFAILRRTSGSLEAELTVSGTARAPQAIGQVRLREGALKLATSLPSVSALELDLVLEPGRVVIARAAGDYGGGGLNVSGTIGIAGPEPELDLAIQGQSIPIVRSAEVTVRTDVDVRLTGPWSGLSLAGDVDLRDARWQRRLDLQRLQDMFARSGGEGGGALELPSITEPPFDKLRLALDVSSDRPVSVRTPLIQAQFTTRFAVRGTGAAPVLDGMVEVRGGRIALPASRLELTSGAIELDPADPGVARLDVSAEGRVSGYDVRARVTGTSADPVVELSSIPPAEQEDLVLLLLAGTLPGTTGFGVDQERVAGEIVAHVWRDLAYDWFGDAGESFADRLEMTTGADVTTSGLDTIEVRFRLSGPPRGKGRVVYMRGERDMYDRVNMGLRFVVRVP